MNLTIAEINALSKPEFVEVFGSVFEHSPWVAEGAFEAKPFASVRELHEAMLRVVEESPEEKILDFIRVHPNLATRMKVGAYSAKEQQGAGLGQLSTEEFERFTRLNQSYMEKFGFPFILAVTGKTKEDIVASMEERLDNSYEAERKQAMKQIARITEIRLNNIIVG
ncbi:2-oxo-4-hydroxy-4-carboxy-5-ureidoimidazoline decarboxylase [Paenibacillus caui]|uniref:2-oxo-4-hydroxy-4-carboxy-5-ureidoimidazoline decarboxylase n=1 Tax=Paenibacillus caui TaxID=2873927 RepID=UPI001CA9E6EB|nr:2-oxo-4-hydroxy-4-carboxy-5-ureidoimidazoline decarboxylase [Paenibacillus caui]